MAEVLEKKKFSLKKFLFGKIDRKIFFLFSFLIFFSLITFSIFIYDVSINILKSEIRNHLESAAESRTNHIETYFDLDTERINLITSRTQLKTDISDYFSRPSEELNQEITAKLNDSKSSIEELECICFINLDGKVIACDDKLLVGRDFSKENFFINGLKKEGAYFFNINNAWKIINSAPVSRNDGTLMGVIITAETLSELEEIVHQRTGLGKTGETLIAFIDETDNIIYPIPRLFENETAVLVGESMKIALKGESVFLEDTLDYRNVNVIAATRYIPDIKMGIVAKIDEKEAIGIVRNKLIFIFIISVLFTLVISSLFSYLISRKISKPIKRLHKLTEEIEKGNFSARADIKTGDELEQTGNSFNKMAESLAKTDEERKQIDKSKTEFLSITSHELRSPMTPMIGQLQMILKNYFGKMNEKQRESLKIVLNNTERLDKIIVDFLEISRIEAARLKFDFKKTDLTKTVESVVKEMKEFMPEKKIKIETKMEKLPIIEVDPDRVSQVFRNLISNAVKFTPENGKIEVSAKLQERMILFSVKDNGVGMSEKEQIKLFEPFYQVENMYSHKSGGTGLGLSIAKGIVESQNGKIWLVSQPGKGTIFYFTVPLKPVREMKAIRLLFSESTKTDEIIKNLFNKYIGPLGEKEFEDLKNSKGITLSSVKEYILSLSKKKIINEERAKEFKSKVDIVLKGEEKETKGNKDVQKEVAEFFGEK